MTSPWTLFVESVRLFLSSFKYLLKFGLVKVSFTLPLVALTAVIAMISVRPIYDTSATLSANPTRLVNLIYLAVPIGIVYLVFYLWLEMASLIQYSVISRSRTLPIKELLSQGWRIMSKILITGLIASLAVVGGFLLLIVPGVIFAVWFTFTTPIVVFENLSGTAALSRSKQIVKGRFWKTVWYLVFPALLFLVYALATSAVSFALPKSARSVFELLTSIATLPYGIVSVIYSFLVYREFTKPNISPS